MTARRSLTPCPLGRLAGRTPSNDDDMHAIGKAARHQRGFYGEIIDDIEDDWLRQAIINRATRRFGKRTTRPTMKETSNGKHQVA